MIRPPNILVDPSSSSWLVLVILVEEAIEEVRGCHIWE